MTGYEKELLALAVEKVQADGNLSLGLAPSEMRDGSPAWRVTARDARFCMVNSKRAPTLTEALTALLRDLGVEVPERPSAERVDYLWGAMGAGSVQRWCMRFAREPLTVLALLEGCEA